jgi:monovalent cation:proton antiporter-2 (CPA2) family protein
MHLNDFLLSAFVYLAAAVISVPIATRLGLGSVLGYLIAGILLGPSVLGLVSSQDSDVMHFAEFGVTMMLFIVGLELQPSKLWELRRSIFGMGLLQVLATALILTFLGIALGWNWRASLTAAIALSLSSTALVLQSLREQALLRTQAGQSAFSVLLFQDIAIIPVFALLPLLALRSFESNESSSAVAALPGWVQPIAIVAAVSFIIAAGQLFMRPALRLIAETRLRELFTATSLLIVVAITLLMGLVGLSPALGAFLGGVVLAESEYRHELEMDLDPFKGLLLAIFFISVGAGIDFGLVASSPFTIAAIVLGFMTVKFAVLLGLAGMFRFSTPASLLFAFALAQGGEFAFVLMAHSATLGLLSAAQANMLTAAVAMSMALSPFLFILHSRVVAPIFSNPDGDRPPDHIDERDNPVIIAGFGRFGMTVARLLQAQGFRTTILDHDASQVEALRRFGFKVFYGDASRPDLLEAAGAANARILVVAVDDQEKIIQIVETAQRQFPHLVLFARAWDRVHAYELINVGVKHVYREVFGSSVDLAEDALAALGLHPYTASRAARAFRHFDQQLLWRIAPLAGDEAAIIDATRAARDEVARVLESDRRSDAHLNDQAWQEPERRPDISS